MKVNELILILYIIFIKVSIAFDPKIYQTINSIIVHDAISFVENFNFSTVIYDPDKTLTKSQDGQICSAKGYDNFTKNCSGITHCRVWVTPLYDDTSDQRILKDYTFAEENNICGIVYEYKSLYITTKFPNAAPKGCVNVFLAGSLQVRELEMYDYRNKSYYSNFTSYDMFECEISNYYFPFYLTLMIIWILLIGFMIFLFVKLKHNICGIHYYFLTIPILKSIEYISFIFIVKGCPWKDVKFFLGLLGVSVDFFLFSFVFIFFIILIISQEQFSAFENISNIRFTSQQWFLFFIFATLFLLVDDTFQIGAFILILLVFILIILHITMSLNIQSKIKNYSTSIRYLRMIRRVANEIINPVYYKLNCYQKFRIVMHIFFASIYVCYIIVPILSSNGYLKELFFEIFQLFILLFSIALLFIYSPFNSLIKILSLEGGNEGENNILNLHSLENVPQIVIEEQQILNPRKSNQKDRLQQANESIPILIINPFNESIPQDYLSKMYLGKKANS